MPLTNSKFWYSVIKRCLDILLSASLLLLFSIPYIIIFILVRLTSPGPGIYWSERVGKNNVLFKMPKFRTMKVGTPTVPTHMMTSPKNYLTPIGPLLRKSSLDELPQLWSILKGDMSFVGPRPGLESQVELIESRTQRGVHTIPPGLTGWAQVNGRDDIDDAKKLDLDYEYYQKRCLLLDLKIIFYTAQHVIMTKGISH